MINKIKRKFSKLNDIYDYQTFILSRIDENLAAFQINSLLAECIYLPFSKASLNFSSLAVVLNDIIVNNRKTIVEFGCGISTIVIAKLIKRNSLKGVKIISIENDVKWLNVIQNLIETENLKESVHLVHAKLEKSEFSLDNNLWYDNDPILSILNSFGKKVDCVLIDGPAAWYKDVYRSRYPAFPFIHKYLDRDCAIFLDDTNRDGEKEIIEMWDIGGFIREDFNNSFTGFFRGDYFNIQLP